MTAYFAIALWLAASTGATTGTTESTAAAQTKKNKPKKICKTDARMTGTRISKRICKTEEEWAKKEDGQDLQTKGHGGNPEPVCALCTQNPFLAAEGHQLRSRSHTSNS